MPVFFQAEDGIRGIGVTGVQTCALPICSLLVAAACSRSAPQPEYRTTATVKDIMDSMVDPNADFLWDSVATIEIGRASGRERVESRVYCAHVNRANRD